MIIVMNNENVIEVARKGAAREIYIIIIIYKVEKRKRKKENI